MLALIWAKVGRMVMAAGAFLAAVLAIVVGSRQAGRTAARTEQVERQLDDVNKVRKVQHEIRRVRNTDLDKRLDKWMRD